MVSLTLDGHSLFFKQNRQEYYDRLDAVRLKGDWLGWLRFFLEGVQQTAQQAADTGGRILRLFEEDRHKVEGLGRKAGSAHRMLEMLPRHPHDDHSERSAAAEPDATDHSQCGGEP
jgi:Fic family protein